MVEFSQKPSEVSYYDKEDHVNKANNKKLKAWLYEQIDKLNNE